jgi:hypothetical protein
MCICHRPDSRIDLTMTHDRLLMTDDSFDSNSGWQTDDSSAVGTIIVPVLMGLFTNVYMIRLLC